MEVLMMQKLNLLLTALLWIGIAMGILLLLKTTFSLLSTVLQLVEERRLMRAQKELATGPQNYEKGPIRSNLNFNTFAEPDISQIDDFYTQAADLTQEELEWAYEQGASSVEEALTLVADSKQGEKR